MRPRVRTWCLWLLVINVGIAFGAGLYEARVVVPGWMSLPVENWPNTGLKFWVYVTTVPLTLLAIINAMALLKDTHPRRRWWRNAIIVLAVERVATFSYFIPGMIAMMNGEAPRNEIEAALSQWLLLNHGRHLLTLSAWLMSLKALSTPPGYRHLKGHNCGKDREQSDQ